MREFGAIRVRAAIAILQKLRIVARGLVRLSGKLGRASGAVKAVEAIRRFVGQGVPAVHRSSQVDLYRSRIKALDASRQWDPNELRTMWTAKSATEGKQ